MGIGTSCGGEWESARTLATVLVSSGAAEMIPVELLKEGATAAAVAVAPRP